MDLEGKAFGRGQRELSGAVDLISQYKLWPHHEFFCKSSLPSISKTCYLQNIVGDTEIRKGEGMELEQLFHNTSNLRDRNTRILPFDLGVLKEAFQMRETAFIDLPSAGKGISTAVMKSSDKRAKGKEKKSKRHRDKNKDYKNHKHHKKNGSSDKKRERHGTEPILENFKQQHDKRRWQNGW